MAKIRIVVKMWYLSKIEDETSAYIFYFLFKIYDKLIMIFKYLKKERFYLLTNKKYKIGRYLANNANSDVEIQIGNDQTVSRLHAELLIKFEENKY